MKVKDLLFASLAVVAAMAAVAVIALTRLPDGAQLVMRWGLDGRPHGSASAEWALFTPPLIVTAISLAFTMLSMVEPMQNRLENSAPLLRAAWAALLVFFAFKFAKIAGQVFGLELPASITIVGIGLILLVIGNAMPKTRPGFFVGIRTPWTLTDTDNWIATHRFGSHTFIIAGVAIVVAALLPLPAVSYRRVVLAATLFATLPPVLFSWWFWRQNGRQTPSGG